MPDEEVRQAGPQRLSSALGHTTAVASSSSAAVVEGEEQQRGEEDDEAPILEILAAVREGRFQDTKDIWIRLLRLCRWESPFLRLSGKMRKETERAAAMPTAEGLRRMREAIDEERARWARLAEGAGDDQMGGVLDLGEEAVSDEEGGGGGGAAPRGGDDKKMRKKHQKQKKTRTTEEEAGETGWALPSAPASAAATAMALGEGAEEEKQDEALLYELMDATREGRIKEETEHLWLRLLRVRPWQRNFFWLSGKHRKAAELASAMPRAEGLLRLREFVHENRRAYVAMADQVDDAVMCRLVEENKQESGDGEQAARSHGGAATDGSGNRRSSSSKKKKKKREQKRERRRQQQDGEEAVVEEGPPSGGEVMQTGGAAPPPPPQQQQQQQQQHEAPASAVAPATSLSPSSAPTRPAPPPQAGRPPSLVLVIAAMRAPPSLALSQYEALVGLERLGTGEQWLEPMRCNLGEALEVARGLPGFEGSEVLYDLAYWMHVQITETTSERVKRDPGVRRSWRACLEMELERVKPEFTEAGELADKLRREEKEDREGREGATDRSQQCPSEAGGADEGAPPSESREALKTRDLRLAVLHEKRLSVQYVLLHQALDNVEAYAVAEQQAALAEREAAAEAAAEALLKQEQEEEAAAARQAKGSGRRKKAKGKGRGRAGEEEARQVEEDQASPPQLLSQSQQGRTEVEERGGAAEPPPTMPREEAATQLAANSQSFPPGQEDEQQQQQQQQGEERGETEKGEAAAEEEGGGLLSGLDELLTCPISMMLMTDPVVVDDGSTYQRDAIQAWFDRCTAAGKPATSPMTGLVLASTDLKPNLVVRALVSERLKASANS